MCCYVEYDKVDICSVTTTTCRQVGNDTTYDTEKKNPTCRVGPSFREDTKTCRLNQLLTTSETATFPAKVEGRGRSLHHQSVVPSFIEGGGGRTQCLLLSRVVYPTLSSERGAAVLVSHLYHGGILLCQVRVGRPSTSGHFPPLL